MDLRFPVQDTGDSQIALAPYLRPHERTLWLDHPHGSLFTKYDLYLVPFSLVWFGGVAFIAFSAAMSPGGQGALVILGPFALIGLYTVAGRLVVKARRRAKTAYALTDQRMIALIGSKLRSLELGQVPGLEVTESASRGSIVFESPPSSHHERWGNTGLDSVFRRRDAPMAFYDIHETPAVADRIRNLATSAGAVVPPSSPSILSPARVRWSDLGLVAAPSRPITILRLVALAGIIYAAAINLATWFPIDMTAVQWIWVPTFVLLFPVFGATMLLYWWQAKRSGDGMNPLRNIVPFLPRWVRIVSVAVVVYVAANFFGSLLTGALPGHPEHVGNRYYFNSHGHRIPTTRSGYVRGVRLNIRIPTGHEIIFFGLPLLALTFAPPIRERASSLG